MTKAGIYVITNLVNNKKYVGSTHNFLVRWRSHKSMLNRGVHFNNHLQNSWNKYGEESFKFSILEEIDDTLDNINELLIEREEFYININDCINNGYNTRSECNTNLGLKWSEESKRKYSEYRKQHIVEEAVQALNEYSKTRVGVSNEAAKQWYASLTEAEKQAYKEKLLNARIEAAKKRGYWHSQETINKIIQTKKDRGLIKSISLYNIDGTLYKVYESYTNCLKEFGENVKNSSCLVNNEKSGKLFHGFIVSYHTEEFLSNYLEIVDLVNSCKSNIKYYKYDSNWELIDIFNSQKDAACSCGCKSSTLKKYYNTNILYKKAYWKRIEPISSDVYSKVGEFSGNPDMDNTEPSFPLTKEEGATTND